MKLEVSLLNDPPKMVHRSTETDLFARDRILNLIEEIRNA